MDDDADAKMIQTAPPPDNLKRPPLPGRTRITWLNTVQRDQRAYNLTLNEAVDLARTIRCAGWCLLHMALRSPSGAYHKRRRRTIYDFVWPQWVRMYPRKMRSCHRRARHHTQGLPSASQLHVSGVRNNRCLAEQTDKLTSPACNDFTGQEPSRVRTIISRMDKYHQLS